jgi:hypothetical protein
MTMGRTCGAGAASLGHVAKIALIGAGGFNAPPAEKQNGPCRATTVKQGILERQRIKTGTRPHFASKPLEPALALGRPPAALKLGLQLHVLYASGRKAFGRSAIGKSDHR